MNDETHAQTSPLDTAAQPETGAEVAGPLRVLAAAAAGRSDTSFLRMPQPARQFGTDDSLAPAAARLAPSCVIPPGMKFKGTADLPCNVRIQGEFEGKVTAAEGFTITVESAGVLSGESHATNIRIEGKADGVIEASGGLASFTKVGGTVHISVGAVVVTDMLVADFVYVEGTVQGDVHARHAVELAATSIVNGSVRYDKHLDIHPGARLTGQMNGPDAQL